MASLPTKLHVVQAYDLDPDSGELVSHDPEAFETADRALRAAQVLSLKHAGVLAWTRDAQPDLGEYGPPTIIFRAGRVPEEME